MLNGCLMLCKAACCGPSQQLPGLVQLLLLFHVKQQAADNAMHINSGSIAIGRLHIHLYNASVLTMKYAHLVLNGWSFTIPAALQPTSLAPSPGWRGWVYVDHPASGTHLGGLAGVTLMHKHLQRVHPTAWQSAWSQKLCEVSVSLYTIIQPRL